MRRIMLMLAFAMTHLEAGEETWTFLDNGKIRLGVNRDAGAAIGWFSESGFDLNYLNRYDHGRYLQQSWYGNPDGSKWNGKPWRWNPVQGGSWRGKPAKLLEFSVEGAALSARSAGIHWASGDELDEVTFQQKISLKGPVAEIAFSMSYSGTQTHAVHDQELPAVFVNAAFPDLVLWKKGATEETRVRPGWPNERHELERHWVAYVNEEDRGIGILVPGVATITAYRFPGDPDNRSKGACSYVAPIRRMSIRPGFRFDYRVFLTIGTLTEIRSRFSAILGEG